MSPLAGHHITVRWLRRRSPNVASVGDLLVETNMPHPRIHEVKRITEARDGLMLIAEPVDEAAREARRATGLDDALIAFRGWEVER